MDLRAAKNALSAHLWGLKVPTKRIWSAAKLIDMKPEEILVLKNAQERGLCAGKLSEIEVLGDDFENIGRTRF